MGAVHPSPPFPYYMQDISTVAYLYLSIRYIIVCFLWSTPSYCMKISWIVLQTIQQIHCTLNRTNRINTFKLKSIQKPNWFQNYRSKYRCITNISTQRWWFFIAFFMTKRSPGQELRQLLGCCLANVCVAKDPFQWLLSNNESFLSWFLKTVEIIK